MLLQEDFDPFPPDRDYITLPLGTISPNYSG